VAISLKHFPAQANEAGAGSELRLLYQLFEEAQRARVAHGERARAYLQGRSSGGAGETGENVDHQLTEISRGGSGGAPRILERAYARAFDEEEMLGLELRRAVEDHPAWPWLEQQRGIGHFLSARILSRLDVTRARTPSAFWAYCGLATVPGTAYRCERCGLEVAYPAGYQVRAIHNARGGTRPCLGELSMVGDAASTRVAPRRTVTGGRATYDAQARNACYLVGVSLLRCRSEYRCYYDAERIRLAGEHPGWSPRRSHLSALRKMEKAFLRDLWLAWRRAVNLPIVQPYFPRATPCVNEPEPVLTDAHVYESPNQPER
jgi:hypothetical protein